METDRDNPRDMGIRPVFIDDAFERIEWQRFEDSRPPMIRRGRRFARWLKSQTGFHVFYELPNGRRSLAAQLSSRLCFPAELWAGIAPLDDATRVLTILKEERGWPNHYFVPDDPLLLLLIPEHDTECMNWVFYMLNDKVGTHYTDDDIVKISTEEWTTGRFVRDAVSRMSTHRARKAERKRKWW